MRQFIFYLFRNVLSVFSNFSWIINSNKLVRLFLDCEFTGLLQNTTLISIALYRNEQCYFYAEFNDYNTEQLTPWIEANVLDKLLFKDYVEHFVSRGNIVNVKCSKGEIQSILLNWLTKFDDIEIWGDIPIYDWMLFCQIFGGARNLPKNIFYIPFDIATIGFLKLQKRDFSRIDYVKNKLTKHERERQHNALIDAKVEKLCFEKFMSNG